jgi:hypothetical protein
MPVYNTTVDLSTTTVIRNSNETYVIDDFSRVDMINDSTVSRTSVEIPLYETKEEQEILNDLETR